MNHQVSKQMNRKDKKTLTSKWESDGNMLVVSGLTRVAVQELDSF
jgi:hypothetical protein